MAIPTGLRESVFGVAAAVLNFNRWPRFLTAAGRRLLATLLVFYFDDASLQDLQQGKGRAQLILQQFAELLGTPFSAKKSTPLGGQADFIGLVHNVQGCLGTGQVLLSPRPSLVTKAISQLDDALSSDFISPAQTSKVRGTLGFLFNGTFGQVGRAGFGRWCSVSIAISRRSPFRITCAGVFCS